MCMFLLWGCPQEGPTPTPTPDEEDPVLEAATSTTEYTIEAQGGEITLKVKSNLSNLDVRSSDPSWLTASVSTKAVTTQQITVKAAENKSVDSRSAKVTVSSDKLSVEFKVTQKGIVPAIDIAILEYPVPAEGGSFTVNVNSNVTYEVKVNANWIHKDGEGFKADANDSEESRTGTITFSYGDLSKTVTVTQSGKAHEEEPYINIGETNAYSVAAAGGTVTIEVQSNVEYETECGAEWVTGSAPTFTVAENTDTKERSTTITFTYENITKTVTITQAGKPEDPYINVDQSVVGVPAAGETFTLNVTSNVQYETEVSAAWVSVNGTSVTVAENTTYEERSATITFKYGTVTTSVIINQAAAIEPDILEYVGDKTYNVPADGYTINVKVHTNVDYTTTISAPDWVKEGTKATREDEKTFIITKNDGEARTATITFSYKDLTRVITIHQAKHTEEPYITIVTSTNGPVAAEGGQFSVEVASNVAYETECGADWVTGAVPTFTVAPNEAYEERSTTITFKYGDIEKSVTVSQLAAIEPDVLEFLGANETFTVLAEGGEVSFVVKTNGEYDVTTNVNWITQIPKSKAKEVREDELTFEVAKNTGDARNGVITVALNDLTITVYVAQDAFVPPTEPYLTINPTSIEMESEGGVFEVTVSTNCEEYEVINGSEWIAEEKTANGYKFTVEANTSSAARTADIQFFSEDLDDLVTLLVSQAGYFDDSNPFDVSGHGNNLSWNGTANCYVVIKEGTYTFDASRMGNGPEGFLWDEIYAETAVLWPYNASQTVFKDKSNQYNYPSQAYKPFVAFEIWDDNNVITDVSLDYTKMIITFTATGNKGNALIGLFPKGTEEANAPTAEALWSWHIWCTDSPKQMSQYYDIRQGYEDLEYVLLDRNIGATSANPADGVATYGYFYQFGRKDPFKAYVGIMKDFGYPAPEEMRGAVNHPNVFYSGNMTKTWEWYNNGDGLARFTANLWGNPRHLFATYSENGRVDHHPDAPIFSELKKTIYDPCPPGYMVPPETTWAAVDIEDMTVLDTGVLIPTASGDSFYPFAGAICGGWGEGETTSIEQSYKHISGWYGYHTYDGSLSRFGRSVFREACVYSSCTGYYSGSGEYMGATYMTMYINNSLSPDERWYFDSTAEHVRTYGRPVRCMRIPEAE